MVAAAIIEIEEGELTCTLAHVGRRSVAIGACARVAFPECTAANLGNTLRLLQDQVGPFARAWVLAGDRRIVHSLAHVPRMEPRELTAFVRREGLRHGGLPATTELVAHATVRGVGAQQTLAICSAPAAALDPIRRGCAEAEVELDGILAIESAIAGVLDDRLPERTAVLDFAAGRARFLVYENGQLSHRRRFLVHGAEAGVGMRELFVAQLAMEVPRTLEYLKEQGCEAPQCLLVAHTIAAGEDLLTMAEGRIGEVRSFVPAAAVADGEDAPNLATFGLLRLLQRRAPLPLLGDGISLQQPPQPLRRLLHAAAALTAVAGLAFGVREQAAAADLRRQHDGLERDRQQTAQEIARRRQPTPMVETEDPALRREREILGRRRPFSRAIARLCEVVGPDMHLDSIAFPDRHHIELRGGVTARNRLAALRAIGEFGDGLTAIPFVVRDGAESVEDDGRSDGAMHFRFDLQWRRP